MLRSVRGFICRESRVNNSTAAFTWQHLSHAPTTIDSDRIDPELLPALSEIPKELANLNRDTVELVRTIWGAKKAKQSSPSSLQIDEQLVPTTNDNQPDVRVYIYRKPTSQTQAGLVWIHGGGYVVGSALDERAKGIAEQLDCTVISVDYRLAPEHPFPAAIEDCHAALLWVVEHADDLGIDANRIAIGGTSAGGGLSAGLALMNRDKGGPTLALQLLLSPMIDNLHDTPSGQITNHPVWNRQTSLNAWQMYLDDIPLSKVSPYAAASRAVDLTGLPPAYISVGTEDLFRDESALYAHRLIAAGVACEFSMYPGVFHGADGFIPTAQVNQRMVAGYRNALAQALTTRQQR